MESKQQHAQLEIASRRLVSAYVLRPGVVMGVFM